VNQLRAVAPLDRAFLGYLIDVRAAVEDRVVALVAGRPRMDLSAVRVVLERSGASLRESGEPGSLDLSFEAALAREAGNPLLAEMQRSVHHLWVEAWSECRIAPGRLAAVLRRAPRDPRGAGAGRRRGGTAADGRARRQDHLKSDARKPRRIASRERAWACTRSLVRLRARSHGTDEQDVCVPV
jgi:hypothetical protein